MLKFIFGRPSSGKTYTILEDIRRGVLNGSEIVLIVPEQYSFEAEKNVLHTVGDSAALCVSVMSFSRIYDEVARNIGGMAGKVLSDSDKIIMMKRAMESAKDNLILWRKYTRSTTFAQSMLDIIGEFKINGVSPEELRTVSQNIASSSLKNKISDICEIYEGYNMAIGERFIDPADTLTKLYRNLEQFPFFKEKKVYIDSFKGFTGQQYKIIDRILSQADDVCIAFNNDTENNNKFGIYSNVKKAIERIERSAKRNGVSVDKPIILDNSRYSRTSLSALERIMAGESAVCEQNDGGITVCKARSAGLEADFAARTIRKLVREENYRYRDFVIIARNAEDYEQAVELACAQNGIGCFTDKRIPLVSFPTSVAVLSAIGAVKRFSTEDILRFHKTGLGTLSSDEVCVLENYTAIWNIKGKSWLDEWDMDVRGFVTDEPDSESKAQLETVNSLRKRAIEPILKFKKSFSGNAEDMARAIVGLLDDCDASTSLKKLWDEFKSAQNMPSSDALKQSHGLFMGILDSIVNCYGKATISTDEFVESLRIAIESSDVGTIPQTLDEVTFGSADRIRPSRPKIAFILGANQGVFPTNVGKSGILNMAERQQLIDNEIEIADNSISAAIDEDYLVYTSVCCPSDKLFISYHTNSLTGEEAQAASFIKNITDNINCNIVSLNSNGIDENNLPETIETAFRSYCENYQTDKGASKTLENALDILGMSEKTDSLKQICEKKSNISPQSAKALYGNEIYMSASKLDTFNRCEFSFFCRYGLRLKKLQPADFDALQRGTIVHYVLERAISDNGKDISLCDEEKISEMVDRYIEEYLDSVSGYRSIETERMRFIISRISRSLKEVLAHIAREFAQSDFEPFRCEMKIGRDGEIPELVIPYESGNIHITGSIDRVDKYNGCIRVIDYKTGSRSFKLPDILFGLNLQMLIYLYAAVRGNNVSDDNAAGIFYLKSQRDLDEKGMAMNGLLKGDRQMVYAMEKENNGEFVPKLTFNKDGSIRKSSSSYVYDEDDFTAIFDHLERLISNVGDKISAGNIAVNPIDGRESPACKYCDFASICKNEGSEARKVPPLKNHEVLEQLKGESENG